MSPNTDFLFVLAQQLRMLLRPVETSLTSAESFSQLLEEYGWVVDPTEIDVKGVQAAFGIGEDLNKAVELVSQISSSTATETPIDQYIGLVEILQRVVSKIGTLSSQSAPTGLSNQLWTTFTSELLEGLVADYLESYQPALFAPLIVLGVVEEEAANFGGATGRRNYVRRRVRWKRLITAVTRPGELMTELYAWNDPAQSFKFGHLFDRLNRLIPFFGLPIELRIPSQQLLDDYYDATNPHRSEVREFRATVMSSSDGVVNTFNASLSIMPIPPEPMPNPSDAPEGLVISPSITVTGIPPVALFWPFTLELSGDFQSDGGIRLLLWPPDKAKAVLTPGTVDASVALINETTYPQILFGTRFSHRLQVFGWKVRLSITGSAESPEVALELALDQAQLVIDNSDADSFLQNILGPEPQVLDLSGSIAWSSKTGLHFEGSASLELVVPINRTIAIAEVQSLSFGVRLAGDAIALVPAVSGRASLGPVNVSVNKLGAKLELTPIEPGQPPGVLGDLDLDFAFKPPDGLGLVVDAGAVTGGGFLEIDAANGRYAGILQLELGDEISISAIGLLDTRLPGGAPGFSFLIIVAAEFPPIQLGFGFALAGVGGLAGINRTIVVDALQAGVRSHSVDNILFPEDPVRNAPQVINDVRTVFPPVEGRYVFGPMASITWGSPTIIEAELGIILELPSPFRLVILGQLNAILPDKEAAVVELHLDVLGIIDFAKMTLSIDASLHDSRIAAFNLFGDMALRLDWGILPNFALAVGGLNPRFQPPPDFPTLRRLTLALGTGENPRLTLQTYTALTSNTAQIGARAEIYAEASGFNILGWIGFDALLIFVPFSFVVDLSAGVTLRRGEQLIGSIQLEATLTGPGLWHAWGEAIVSLPIIGDIPIPFDARFGEEVLAPLLLANPWDELQREIEDPRNWSPTPPQGASRVVTLTAPENNPSVLIDPLGGLKLRQKAVPLNRKLTKYGESKLDVPVRFDVDGVSTLWGKAEYNLDAREHFAPAAITWGMTDAEKLSLPSFELMDAGFTLETDKMDYGDLQRGRDLTYETKIVDKAESTLRPAGEYRPALALQMATLGRGAAALSLLKTTGLNGFAPPPDAPPRVKLEEERYVIVSTDQQLRTSLSGLSEEMSKTVAYQALSDYVRENPRARDQLQVMAAHEVKKDT